MSFHSPIRPLDLKVELRDPRRGCIVTGPSWIRDGESDRTLEENWLFRLRRERYRSRASGRSHDFFVLHLADAVHVVALTTDRQFILVRQFRAGSGRDSLETPGGLLEPGEDVGEAGARELLEETGYAGDLPGCSARCGRSRPSCPRRSRRSS